MLEVGISSTRQIARFWNLAKPAARRAATKETVLAISASTTALKTYNVAEKPRAVRIDPAAEAWPGEARPSATGVTKVIEDALRAAGLMR